MLYIFENNRNKEYEKINTFRKENDLCINDLAFYVIYELIKHNVAKAVYKTVGKEEYEVIIKRRNND